MNRSAQTTVTSSKTRSATASAKFDRLILWHELDLMRFARRLCGRDEDRAQDLVQETLVRAFGANQQGRFREGSNARAWLFRIVTNLYINDYNHRRRWEASVGLDSRIVDKKLADTAHHAALRHSPATAIMANMLDETVERALASLPTNLRMCIVLVDVEGLNYAQAAQRLSIPIGTVRSRLSRSRSMLQPLLRKYVQERR